MEGSEPEGGGEEPTHIPCLDEEGNGAAAQSSDLREHEEEYKLEEDLSDGGKMGNEVTSEGAGDKSERSMDSLEHCLDNVTSSQALKSADRICLFALPRNLKELSDVAKEKELMVQKLRDELTACQLRITTLGKQLEDVDIETEEEKEAGNVAAVFRLQATHRRLRTELEDEKNLELKIALRLEENTLEMWQIETQKGKYEILHKQLTEDEEELEMQYQEQAEERIRKEKIAALKAEENQLSLKKKEEKAQKEYEKRRKKMLEGAKRNHEKAVYFLRKSMARIHEKNAKEEAKTREHMERRIQAVLSLKNSITSNREKLQALQAWNQAMASEAKKQEMTMREAILAEGSNVAKEIFLHKRLLQHEKEKQAFREQQKSRKIEIVSKILQERASIFKQKSQQSCKAIKSGGKCKDSLLWRKKTWRYIEKACKHPAGALPQESWCSPSLCSPAGERTASVGKHSEKVPHDVLCESDEDEKERDKIPADPELPGLSSEECDLHEISKEEVDTKHLATRVMKTEILEEKKEEFQTRIFNKRTVSGHEQQGRTFYSKPSCIHFKDFDVGKIYKKKIVLINASYSINYCKPVGISEWLKDFISIQFDPPGKMSAGMSCEVGVTFKPAINEDLEGEVMFMAQTGSFSVPLKCTAKTCILALDKVLVDFGTHVVGETISQTVNLTNTGALGTRFKVQTSAGDSSRCGATAESSTTRTVSQPCSDSTPEKKDSNSSVTSVLEKKEQICPDGSEEPTCCVAQAEQQRTETSSTDQRGSGVTSSRDTERLLGHSDVTLLEQGALVQIISREQLAQDAFNFSSDKDTDNVHNFMEHSPEETPIEIMLGKVTEGEIGPFSSVKLQIIFMPSIPGDVRADFVIVFDNADCKPLYFSAIGVSIDVPVWVPNPNIDLKICMYDRLYQDCIVIRSRAKTTLHLKFEVCKELSKHMKLLPKTGYIQPQSSFSVQLKFLPRCQMHKEEINLDRIPMRKCFSCSDSSSVKILAVAFLVDCFHFCGDAILTQKRSYLGRWLLHGSVIQSFLDKHSCLARLSLPEDAGNCFNEETSVLEAPVTIQIADNTKQINFTVHAIVTTSDLEISPAEINFGYCTIYEAVRTNVTLTNKSILPQEFGFVRLPEFVEIQPNDGLGVLLPLESLTLHIIFKANKAKEYSFELTCKSEVNRQFKLSCRAVGVHPPLELSHSLVQFAATALNDVSTATLYVMNSHVSVNLFTHAVPRIGNGEVAPVGPTSFEFCVPEDCPVTITPSVGTVLPGKKSLIQVSFRPTLSDQLIREEAAQRLCAAAATGAEIQETKKDEKREGKKLSVSISRRRSSRKVLRTGSAKYLSSSCEPEQPESTEIKPDSEAYIAAQAFLTRNFRGRFEKYTIPCFVASGDIDEKRGLGSLSFSPYNTLYLELHCPAVAPSVVVTSDNGKNTIDFGDVAVGQTVLKQTTIQNISPEKLELRFSVLNPSGPFLLVRPVRVLEPGEIRTLITSFSPNKNKLFFEMLDVQTVKNNLPLRITGYGVVPSTVCTVEEVLDMGYVLTREKATSTFKVQNTSTLTLQYSIHLDSFSSTRDEDQQRVPSFLMSSLQGEEIVETENSNGVSVFSVLPTEGEIPAGESQDFTVTFSPEHESLYYSECLKVVLFGKKTAHVIQLKGAARDHPMFVEGGIPLDVPIESLAVTLPLSSKKAQKEELQEPVKSILLLLEHTEGENALLPAVTELKVGAIQTAQFASKKNVEFSFDNLSHLQKKGFAIEPVKGKVDRGHVKRISVCWVPPADFDASVPLVETAFLNLKGGDIKESYLILFVVTAVSAPTR